MTYVMRHYTCRETETWAFDWKQLPGSDELHCLAALFVICLKPRPRARA